MVDLSSNVLVKKMQLKQSIGRLFSQTLFTNDIPKENIRKLGGAYWKRAKNKQGYVSLQESVLEDDITSDLCIDNDEEFRQAMYESATAYKALVKRIILPRLWQSKTLDFETSFDERLHKSKSAFATQYLYENTAKYMRKAADRKGKSWDLEPETKKLRKQHLKLYTQGLKNLRNFEPEKQEMVILGGIIGNTNLGYDAFVRGSKNSYVKTLKEYCQRHLSFKFKVLDVDTAFKIFGKAFAKKHNPPFVLFYRTHTWPKHRSVYGAGVLGKLAAALIHAAKVCCSPKYIEKVEKTSVSNRDKLWLEEPETLGKYLPKIGSWSWIAWDDWSIIFSNIEKSLSVLPASHDVVGADFSGYDQSLIPADFNFITDVDDEELRSLYEFAKMQISDAEVWTAVLRLLNIYFKSGTFDTQEDGSFIHLDRDIKVAKDLGCHICNAEYLSDDNLTEYDMIIDSVEYAKAFAAYGLKVNADKSSIYSRDHFIGFLGNLVGPIFTEDQIITIGDFETRFYNFCHIEREAEERGVYDITGQIAVDQAVSKLASIGSAGTVIMLFILNSVKHTALGQKMIKAIIGIKTGVLIPRPIRSDLSISFKPVDSFKELDVQAVLSQ